eukprot:3594276-Lingulodinium_polyedra.AAC.1
MHTAPRGPSKESIQTHTHTHIHTMMRSNRFECCLGAACVLLGNFGCCLGANWWVLLQRCLGAALVLL